MPQLPGISGEWNIETKEVEDGVETMVLKNKAKEESQEERMQRMITETFEQVMNGNRRNEMRNQRPPWNEQNWRARRGNLKGKGGKGTVALVEREMVW